MPTSSCWQRSVGWAMPTSSCVQEFSLDSYAAQLTIEGRSHGAPRTSHPRAGGDPGRTTSLLTSSREQILGPVSHSIPRCWHPTRKSRDPPASHRGGFPITLSILRDTLRWSTLLNSANLGLGFLLVLIPKTWIYGLWFHWLRLKLKAIVHYLLQPRPLPGALDRRLGNDSPLSLRQSASANVIPPQAGIHGIRQSRTGSPPARGCLRANPYRNRTS